LQLEFLKHITEKDNIEDYLINMKLHYFAFLLGLLFLPSFVHAEYVPAYSPDYGSFQQQGEYLHIRTGFACESSAITIGFTNLLSNVASDISAGGVVQDNDGEYIDYDPPISSGVWYFSIYNLYSGFDTVYPISYFTNLWPDRVVYKAVLDCNTGSETIRSWFLINTSSVVVTQDGGDLIFGIGILIFLMTGLYAGFVYNAIVKKSRI